MFSLQYASEDAELLLVGNKLDCEVDREITRQQGEKVRTGLTKLLVWWHCSSGSMATLLQMVRPKI